MQLVGEAPLKVINLKVLLSVKAELPVPRAALTVCLVASTPVARGPILVRTVTFGLARSTMRLSPGYEA